MKFGVDAILELSNHSIVVARLRQQLKNRRFTLGHVRLKPRSYRNQPLTELTRWSVQV